RAAPLHADTATQAGRSGECWLREGGAHARSRVRGGLHRRRGRERRRDERGRAHRGAGHRGRAPILEGGLRRRACAGPARDRKAHRGTARRSRVSPASDYGEYRPKTLAEWRRWLRANHAKAPGVWFLTSRRIETGLVPYENAVEEALCWGWIDGQYRPV